MVQDNGIASWGSETKLYKLDSRHGKRRDTYSKFIALIYGFCWIVVAGLLSIALNSPQVERQQSVYTTYLNLIITQRVQRNVERR